MTSGGTVRISVDRETYGMLESLKRAGGFRSVREMVTAAARVMSDRMREAAGREYDIPEDDGLYLDRMFAALSSAEAQPDGTVPVRHPRRGMESGAFDCTAPRKPDK